MDTVQDGGVWSTQTIRKLNRLSTGGTFSKNISKDTVCKISRSAFKKMAADEKLVSLFEIMTSGFGSMNSRVSELDDNVHVLLLSSAQSERRIKLLEYRSIDQEARSWRNNLIFCGHVEVAGHDDPEAIIRTFLADNFDMRGVCIHRAHRLGPLRQFGRRNRPHGPRRSNARSIILCSRTIGTLK